MSYIPDPIERMESRIDELAYQYGMLNRDTPAGKFVCPYCRQLRDGEPIMLTGAPDSPAMCYECLPDDVKKLWDKFDKGRHRERLDQCRREGSDANDHNHRVWRAGRGTTKGNPYQVQSEEWCAWRDGYAYRDMVNDG